MSKIIIKNPKLLKLLQAKSSIVEDGRKISEEIENIDKEMSDIDKQITDIEKTVDIKDIDEEAKILTEEYNKLGERMNEIQKKVFDRLSQNIPQELRDKYEELKKAKEEKEEQRNKCGLSIQKHNDLIIPITRKELKKYINDEYDDYESIKIEDGEIVGTLFNHLEEFKKNFKKRV